MGIDNRTCFQVNLRDRLCCRVCGREPLSQQDYHRGLEYHHLQARSEGGADVVENLILLCHNCHTLHHQRKMSLPQFDYLKLHENFACYQCGADNSIKTIEMNCGWYRCATCGKQTHLWEHCGFSSDKP